MQPRLYVLPPAVPVQPVRRLGAAHVAVWQPQQRQVLASRSPPGHRAIPESRHPEVLPRRRGAEGSGSSAEARGSLVEVYGGLAGLHGAVGYLPGSSGGLYGSTGELPGSKRGPALRAHGPSPHRETPPARCPSPFSTRYAHPERSSRRRSLGCTTCRIRRNSGPTRGPTPRA